MIKVFYDKIWNDEGINEFKKYIIQILTKISIIFCVYLGCGGNELDAPGGAHEDLSQAPSHRRVHDVRGGREADTQRRVCLISI